MSKFILSAFADEAAEDLKTQMDILESHGINHIEMRGVNGKNVADLTIDEAKSIKKELDARGFKISALSSPIGKQSITDDFGPHLEKFKNTLEVAKILDTEYIRMFSFFIPKDTDPAVYRDEVMRRWKGFVKAAEGTGLVLLHENEKDIYGETPERCLDIIETMDSPNVKAIFDPANFVQCDVKNYPEAYEVLRDHTVYMHIKDAVYSDHHVVPSGYGDGNVKEILSELYKKGFEGFLSLEPHLGNFTGFAALEPDAAHLPEGDSIKNFGIAVYALKKIISAIEQDNA